MTKMIKYDMQKNDFDLAARHLQHLQHLQPIQQSQPIQPIQRLLSAVSGTRLALVAAIITVAMFMPTENPFVLFAQTAPTEQSVQTEKTVLTEKIGPTAQKYTWEADGIAFVVDPENLLKAQRDAQGNVIGVEYMENVTSQRMQTIMRTQERSYKDLPTNSRQQIRATIGKLKKVYRGELPVFRMMGTKIGIPGNVLVTFPATATQKKIQKWERDYNMSRISLVSKQRKMYKYLAGGGLYAIEMARLLNQEARGELAIIVTPVMHYDYVVK